MTRAGAAAAALLLTRLVVTPLVLTLLVIAGCTAEPLVLDRTLQPGDRVVVVSPADDLDRARASLVVADASGRVTLAARDGERVAVAVLPQSAMIDARGDGAPWDGLTVAFDGADGACGCHAPTAALPQTVAPGDRCALPEVTALDVIPAGADDRALVDAVRARLRLVWPGACACAVEPLASAARVEVCPIGDDAERQHADQLAVADDGTIIAVSRGMVRHLLPDGEAREHPFAAALEPRFHVVTIGSGGDAVVLTQRHHELGRAPELLFLARHGTAPPVALAGLPSTLVGDAIWWDARRERLWVIGREGNDLGRRPAVARCVIDALARRVDCDEAFLPIDAACPQHTRGAGLVVMDALDGGELIAMTSDGEPVFFAAGTAQPVCLPDADDVVPIPVIRRESNSIEQLAVVGRTVVVCGTRTTAEGITLHVRTATIGPIARATKVAWTDVATRTTGILRCGEIVRDPTRPGVILQPIGWGVLGEHAIVEVSGATGAVTVHDSALALFPDAVDSPLAFAASATHLAALTPRGEVLALDGGVVARRSTLDGLGPRARNTMVSAIRASGPGEFAVDLGGTTPLTVTTGAREGCDEVRRVVPDGALDAHAMDAVGMLGDQVVRAFHTGRGNFLQVGEVAEPQFMLTARALRIREIGRWAFIVDVAGIVSATDGREVIRVDHATNWIDGDAFDGVGWVASADRLGRITAGPDGRPRIETGILERVDTRPIAAAYPQGFILTAVHALCGGRALIAVRSNPPDGLGQLGLWWIEPRADRLVLAGYDAIGTEARLRGVGLQVITAISGPDRAPVALFGGLEAGMLVAPHAPFAALPFPVATAFAHADGDILVGGNFGRLALVRVR